MLTASTRTESPNDFLNTANWVLRLSLITRFNMKSSCCLGGAVASWLVCLVSGSGSSSGQGHCVVFLGKTLYSHSDSLHPGVQMDTANLILGVTLRSTSIPSRGMPEILLVALCCRNWDKLQPGEQQLAGM